MLRRLVIIAISVLQVASAQQGTRSAHIIWKTSALTIVRMVRPKISPDAKDIFGSVTLQVVVDKEGKAASAKVIKGHPILASAVLDAVKQWRWKPVMLNGLPVEVETTVTVKFEPR